MAVCVVLFNVELAVAPPRIEQSELQRGAGWRLYFASTAFHCVYTPRAPTARRPAQRNSPHLSDIAAPSRFGIVIDERGHGMRRCAWRTCMQSGGPHLRWGVKCGVLWQHTGSTRHRNVS